MTPVLRIARPSDDLPALARFYEAGLGLTRLSGFTGHGGFDGVMYGLPGAPYHLEFTRAEGHQAGRAPSPEHLLVLYLPDGEAWAQAVNRLRDAGFPPVPAFNPYWDQHGLTFEDPDGYRVVLQRAAWPA